MQRLGAGRSGRARTRDLRFWRPLLYQLSYTPVPTSASGVGCSVSERLAGRLTSILRARRLAGQAGARPTVPVTSVRGGAGLVCEGARMCPFWR